MEIKQYLRKYLIMGSQDCDRDPAEILEAAAKAGITAFQYREKGTGSLSGRPKKELGIQLRRICREYLIPFIINDDLELASELDADGVHIGQEDASAAEVRRLFPDKIIGLSVSSQTEVDASPLHAVDYLGAGPIFDTRTKSDAKEAVGLDWIVSLRSQFPEIPITGIGGINTGNADAVIKAGADGVAVISAVIKAEDIAAAVRGL